MYECRGCGKPSHFRWCTENCRRQEDGYSHEEIDQLEESE